MTRLLPVSAATALLCLLSACGGGGTEPAAGTANAGAATEGRVRSLAAVVSGGILRFTMATQDNDHKIVVGPALGEVRVFGEVGAPPDGRLYTGIRRIEWLAGTGNDKLQLEVTQAADFDVRIATSTGSSEVSVKWTIPADAPETITPSLEMSGGPGLVSKWQVQVESFAPVVPFSVTSTGATEFKGEMAFKQGTRLARPSWNINTGWNSKSEVTVQSEAWDLDASFAYFTGTEVTTKVLSPNTSNSARVVFTRDQGNADSGITKFEMETAAARVDLDYALLGYAGASQAYLTLNSKAPAIVRSNLGARFGVAGDKLEAIYSGAQSSFTIGGTVLMGGGNDEAKVIVDGAHNNTAFIDCGDGFDKAFGFGSAMSCESQ